LLVGVLDLVARLVLDLLRVSVELLERMQRQIASRRSAQVKVLVEPLLRRDEHAALLPGRDDLLLPLLPQDRVALAGGDDDHPPRPVPVRLLVAARWEDGHMAGHLRPGKLDLDRVPTRAA